MTVTFEKAQADADKAAAEHERLALKVQAMFNRREAAASASELAFWQEAERTEIPALRKASEDAQAAFAEAAAGDATLTELLELHVTAERIEQLYRSGSAEIWYRLDMLAPLPHTNAQGERSRVPVLWLHRKPVPFTTALDAVAQTRMAAIPDEPAADRQRRLQAALDDARARADREGD
jgi:hypothetical protein